MTLLLIAAATCALAALLVGVVRRYALKSAVVDLPSDRSSHATPTPRGGGAGLLVAWAVVFVVEALRPPRLSLSLACALAGVLIVAWVGWRDDHQSLGVRTRLAAHITAAVAFLPLALLPAPMPAFPIAVAIVWWVVWIVSAINVANFMDGIDGLIGLEMAVFGGYLALLAGPSSLAGVGGAVLLGACAGFLCWNWSPARIFLGDVGSGAVGAVAILIGILALRDGYSFVPVFLPLYPLVLDASVTLVKRWRRGERLTEPHRSHLYQRLANGGWGHAPVSLLYAATSVFATIPALLVPVEARNAAILGYIAAVPLVGFWLERRLAKRGSPERVTIS
jgi:UDP-N-acetylmuramyl pentapeptide phosphotransferase/UDP-N-acetylglucosamine-1-phosphate transferase